jgi:hypothetical protein
MVATAPNVIIPKFRPKEDKGWWQTIERNMRLGIGQEKVLMQNRMKENARLEAMTPRKTVEGLGQLTAIFDLNNYLRFEQMDPGCWGNKKWSRSYIAKNPEVKASRPERKYI